MRKKTAGLAALICAAGLISVTQTDTVLADGGFSYEDVANREFLFCSGAGAWSTVLTIHEDGTFEGYYHDTDIGFTEEGNPNGTRYVCNFSGQFTEPVQVNEYTYSAQLQTLQCEQEPGTEEIIEGIKNMYSEPYGLDNAENILFYIEGAPIAELPEGYRSWVGYLDLANLQETSLPFIGLYNEAAQQGFSSAVKEGSAPVTEETSDIDAELAETESKAAELQGRIDSALTQEDINILSGELYRLWDDELNSIWGRLKAILPADTMEQLTDEEIAWIEEKEAAVAAAGREAAGGSMQPMLEKLKGSELTKARVYVLAEYLR